MLFIFFIFKKFKYISLSLEDNTTESFVQGHSDDSVEDDTE